MPRVFLFIIILLSFSALNHLSAQEQDYQSIDISNESDSTGKKKEKRSKNTDNQSQNEQENADKTDNKWNWSNFRIGGNFGLSFGQTTYIEASPAFSYWLKPEKFQVGISSKFIYQSVRFDTQQWKSFLYGGGFFADYVIWRGIFAHGEFELINKESYFNTNRVNVPHLLLGGGYLQPVGDAGHFYIAALFNVLDSDESIYANTFGGLPLILRMGFGFGFPGGRRN